MPHFEGGFWNLEMKALNPLNNHYVHFLSRLAAIKQLLCVCDEAIKEYKLILEMQPDYVPALKGLFLCPATTEHFFTTRNA